MVPLALGSETGGSVRQPAALCGVVGLKPTYGRVSRYGLHRVRSSTGPGRAFATSVADAAAVLQVLAGPDPRDATIAPRRRRGLRAPLPARRSSGLRDRRARARCLTRGRRAGVRARSTRRSRCCARPGRCIVRHRAAARAATRPRPTRSSSWRRPARTSGRYDGVRYGTARRRRRSLSEMYIAHARAVRRRGEAAASCSAPTSSAPATTTRTT